MDETQAVARAVFFTANGRVRDELGDQVAHSRLSRVRMHTLKGSLLEEAAEGHHVHFFAVREGALGTSCESGLCEKFPPRGLTAG